MAAPRRVSQDRMSRKGLSPSICTTAKRGSKWESLESKAMVAMAKVTWDGISRPVPSWSVLEISLKFGLPLRLKGMSGSVEKKKEETKKFTKC